eukprot:TRINITY_DN6939_c0_g1_i1.p1 TRINITY_DN6939_c0_g1~~TRINITY_DN6939_c0_g1_i1.p1  ORF type:complete len:193 (+),score=71.20 TRINITY_DN6939_c0_g1_i1:53-631(+)
MEPKVTAPQMDGEKYIDMLRSELYNNDETYKRFFPDDLKRRYLNNFNLFDRDEDTYLNYDEVIELLNSINQVLLDKDLKFLFDALDKDKRGLVAYQDFEIIVYKKFRDDDKKAELINAFLILDKNETGILESDAFKEMLMGAGFRFTEEKADDFIKLFDPKSEGKFAWKEVIDTLYMTEKKPKKKPSKKKKK